MQLGNILVYESGNRGSPQGSMLSEAMALDWVSITRHEFPPIDHANTKHPLYWSVFYGCEERP